MAIQFSAFVARWSDLRGRIPAATHAQIGREAAERARPVAFRAAPLDLTDLATRMEEALA